MRFPAVGRKHIMDQWRPSIESTVEQSMPIGKDKPTWAAPPLPPIPTEKEPQAWRKRSLKRCSYASQMSNYSTELASDLESKHRRKVSAVSVNPSVKSTPSTNFSRPTRWREDRSQSVDLNWKLASWNPNNWPKVKKWFHTTAAGAAAFTCTLASAIIPPAAPSVDGRTGELRIIAVLPLALFAVGLAFGPTLNSLCSDVIGRKVVSIISMAAFALVTLGSAFVTSYYPFVVCRFAAAILASPALDASLMMLIEIWSIENRQLPMAFFSLLLLAGFTLGPVIGPYVLNHEDRSWLQYVTLFSFVPTIVLMVGMRETHRNTLRRRTSSRTTRGRLNVDRIKALGRPYSLLCIRPRILLCTIFASCNFATFFAVFTAFPGIFAETYPARFKSKGLDFVGMVVGVLIGFTALTLIYLLTQHLRTSRLNPKGLAQSEKEKAAISHVQMEGRASITPLRHTASTMSDLGLSRNASRSSLPLKAAANNPTPDLNKNMDLAIAVAHYLNDLSSNKGNRIEPERVLSVLEHSLAFQDLCLLLDEHNLLFDRAKLGRILADALPNGPGEAKTLTKPLPLATTRLSTPTSDDQVWPLSPDSPKMLHPPRESQFLRNQGRSQRRRRSSTQAPLWVGLIGSILSTGGIFMFAWTVNLKLAWIIPVVAMGVFACGGTLVFVSGIEYSRASSSSPNGEHAVTACSTFRWVFAAACSIIAVPLFNGIDTAWAASVLGFINAVGTLLALLLLVLDRSSKDSSRRQSAA